MISRATVPTVNASKYLQQLCKHWQHDHDFTVTFDAHKGSIDFGDEASSELFADDTTLTVTVSHPSLEQTAEWEEVVADHIKRYAFREELTFDWVRSEN
jgi:uncharacterized protein